MVLSIHAKPRLGSHKIVVCVCVCAGCNAQYFFEPLHRFYRVLGPEIGSQNTIKSREHTHIDYKLSSAAEMATRADTARASEACG